LKAEDISIDYRLFGSKIQYYKLKADSLCKIVAWYKKFGYFMPEAGEFVNRLPLRLLSQDGAAGVSDPRLLPEGTSDTNNAKRTADVI